MKLSRGSADTTTDVLDEATVEQSVASTNKGRPTPKRRESQGKRGPVRAPQTRKEAIARQRQLAKDQRSAARTAKPRSTAEQRVALRRGDPDSLPRRDQGPTRKIARDYVDANRMFSNYLLLLFPIMIVPLVVRQLAILQAFVLLAFVGFLIEWYFVGRKIRRLATERHGSADGGNLGIGFYAGSRAYLPRKWRMPAPQVERGDAI